MNAFYTEENDKVTKMKFKGWKKDKTMTHGSRTYVVQSVSTTGLIALTPLSLGLITASWTYYSKLHKPPRP